MSLRVQMWDIAGQDRNHSLMHVYYKGTHGCAILFDVTNRESFSNALEWKRSMEEQCVNPSYSRVPCLLLANKADLKSHQVTSEEINSLANENGFVGWSYISVLKNTGIR